MTLLKKYHPEGFIKQKHQYIVLQQTSSNRLWKQLDFWMLSEAKIAIIRHKLNIFIVYWTLNIQLLFIVRNRLCRNALENIRKIFDEVCTSYFFVFFAKVFVPNQLTIKTQRLRLGGYTGLFNSFLTNSFSLHFNKKSTRL